MSQRYDRAANVAKMTDHQQKATGLKLSHQPPPGRFWESLADLWRRKTTVIAAFSVAAIILHLILRFGFRTSPGAFQIPLWATLTLGGIPLVYELCVDVDTDNINLQTMLSMSTCFATNMNMSVKHSYHH